MSLTFSGNVEDDLNTLREIITGMTHSQQYRARRTAEKIGTLVEQLKKDNPKDAAVGVGLLFAVLTVADQMTKSNKSLIQLL